MWKEVGIDAWLEGRKTSLEDARTTVTEIIGRVQNEGDAALRDLAKKYVELTDIAVSDDEREAAYDEVDVEVIEALVEAHARIERFHELQKPKDLWLQEIEPGIVLGMKTTALNRVGIYVPGGRAAYPSSALMCAVPAWVAGVKEICACSPPPIKPLTLVALDIAGVTEIYSAGGAQAIAAMALGTESIRPVQKIVGPGNIYVTLAKMMLREHAEIDFPAGPSEIGIIADSTANPRIVAADVLAQAEHDPNAACILITTDKSLPAKVGKEIETMVAQRTPEGYHRPGAEELRLYHCRRYRRGMCRVRCRCPGAPFHPGRRPALRGYQSEERRRYLCREVFRGCLRGLRNRYQPLPPDRGLLEDVLGSRCQALLQDRIGGDDQPGRS